MALRVVDFHAGWEKIQRAIDRIVSFVDDNGVIRDENFRLFSASESMSIYETVYNLCTQKDPAYEKELYRRYEDFLNHHINTRVLPAMRGKSGEHLLRETVRSFRDYKFIMRWMTLFFLYLDQFFVGRYNRPTIRNAALLILHNQVYEEMKGDIISTVLSLINEDRDGKPVDRALVKQVLEVVFDLQSETLNVPYQTDFEPALLDSSGAYYALKMANWLQNLPYPEYMLQVVECLNAENFRAMQYLHPSTVPKLLERTKFEIANPDRIDANFLAGKVQQLKLGSNSYYC
ncbi:Cullin family protein [Rhynchospora pubera]|uniref:Cullin family protein n=1 Tax=Rhynchospora pubera TaxID=906938 RepID=A0AAV8DJU6_9POAL|nr:Cullin family protein [Rhynchospora pubera]